MLATESAMRDKLSKPRILPVVMQRHRELVSAEGLVTGRLYATREPSGLRRGNFGLVFNFTHNHATSSRTVTTGTDSLPHDQCSHGLNRTLDPYRSQRVFMLGPEMAAKMVREVERLGLREARTFSPLLNRRNVDQDLPERYSGQVILIIPSEDNDGVDYSMFGYEN